MKSTCLRIALVSAALLPLSCMPTPPAPPAPRTALAVAAPFARTWEAAVDVFAERNIAIKTLDRASGLIVAEAQAVAYSDADGLADCGKDGMGMAMFPNAATWNLIVRGDSTRSTVKANVRFVISRTSRLFGTDEKSNMECSTHGVWETDLEKALKAAAENKK